jgi:hypothetical protein
MFAFEEFVELFLIPAIFLSIVGRTNGVQEFQAYRMQQFDLHGNPHGCRSAYINMEARPAKSRMLGRRCVVIRLAELTMEKFRELSVSGAGAVVVLLPTDLSDVSQEMIQSWMELEQGLLEEPINIPVYFIYEDSNARKVYNDISVATTSDEASSAAAALFDIFSTQGYQIVTAGSESKPIKDVVIPNIQGKLVGYGVEEQLPTIAIIAHYDTYGIAPVLFQYSYCSFVLECGGGDIVHSSI